MNAIRFLLPLVLLALPVQAKLKVFILAGQSNMEGAGQIQINPRAQNKGEGTLEFLVKNAPKKYGALQTKSGEWTVRTDVWVKYGERSGGLKPGFGARSSTIGPELGFGTVVGDALKEPVLIIKTCWQDVDGGFPPALRRAVAQGDGEQDARGYSTPGTQRHHEGG